MGQNVLAQAGAQVEVGMIGKVDGRGLVGSGGVVDLEGIVDGEGVHHGHGQVAGKALFPVLAQVGQG